MALPFQFANVSTLSTPQLDANYDALGALTPIPCSIAGTNDLTLTPLGDTPAVAAYSNYMQFTGIATGTNTTVVTAQVGALAALPVYRDMVDGVANLIGGEIATFCAVTLMYDSALNSGNGGFHLLNPVSSFITHVSQSIGWPNIPATSASVSHVFIEGVNPGDIVTVGTPASVPTGIMFFGWVSATSTISVQAYNITAASITPVAGTYSFSARRY